MMRWPDATPKLEDFMSVQISGVSRKAFWVEAYAFKLQGEPDQWMR
jgi:hypothetical protein